MSAEANQNDGDRNRANQVADNFRALVALILSAALGAELVKGSPQNPVSWVGLLAIGALFLLGQSWLIQKRKAQARRSKKDLDDQKLGILLQNWIYDAIAYALLLGAGALIAFENSAWAALAATIAAALFIAGVCLLRWGVRQWEDGKETCCFVKSSAN
ncbi:MAG: hypothetical protein ACOZAA_05305 [Pseudomonadota bacterium]